MGITWDDVFSIFAPKASLSAQHANTIGRQFDRYKPLELPPEWNNMQYHTIVPTEGLLDFRQGERRRQEEAVYVHLIGAGGRYGTEMARGLDPQEVARIKDMHAKLVKYEGPMWYKPYFRTTGQINARAKEAFEADQHEKQQLQKYYENRLKHALKAEMVKLLEEANIEGERIHYQKYMSGTLGTWGRVVKDVYAELDKCCPGLMGRLEEAQRGFDALKRGLDEFQKWVDENSIPVLNEIRDFYAWYLKQIQKLGDIPGVDELTETLFGKKLSEMDLLDMVDTGAQIVNPYYAAVRGAMELNRQLRENLEAKDELDESEWLDLYNHYLVEFLEAYQIPAQVIDYGEIEGFDTSAEPSLMLTQLIRPGYTKPPDANTDLITKLPGKSTLVERDSVVITQTETAVGTTATLAKPKAKKQQQQSRGAGSGGGGGGLKPRGYVSGGKDLPNIYGT